MLTRPVGQGIRIWLYQGPTDMRRSYYGLASLAAEVLKQDPLSGHWFVFYNRRRNLVKILCWEGDGYALWQKRLEGGVYRFPENRSELSLPELGLVLAGIEWKEVRRSRRYSIITNNK